MNHAAEPDAFKTQSESLSETMISLEYQQAFYYGHEGWDDTGDLLSRLCAIIDDPYFIYDRDATKFEVMAKLITDARTRYCKKMTETY